MKYLRACLNARNDDDELLFLVLMVLLIVVLQDLRTCEVVRMVLYSRYHTFLTAIKISLPVGLLNTLSYLFQPFYFNVERPKHERVASLAELRVDANFPFN